MVQGLVLLFIDGAGCWRSSASSLGGGRFLTVLALSFCRCVLRNVCVFLCSLGGFQVTPCSSSHPLRLLLSNNKREKRELFSFRISQFLGCKHVSQRSSLPEFQTATAPIRQHRRKNCTTPSDLEVGTQQHLFTQRFQEHTCHSPHSFFWSNFAVSLTVDF